MLYRDLVDYVNRVVRERNNTMKIFYQSVNLTKIPNNPVNSTLIWDVYYRGETQFPTHKFFPGDFPQTYTHLSLHDQTDAERVQARIDAIKTFNEGVFPYVRFTCTVLSTNMSQTKMYGIGDVQDHERDAIEQLIFDNRLFIAIKFYRECLGRDVTQQDNPHNCKLKNAKDVIDALREELLKTQPERFTMITVNAENERLLKRVEGMTEHLQALQEKYKALYEVYQNALKCDMQANQCRQRALLLTRAETDAQPYDDRDQT